MIKNIEPSTRAAVITRRTYSRPLDETGEVFESWGQTVTRVIGHQKWLWERQLGREINEKEGEELLAFEALMLERKASVSGRTLWLGGTDVAKTRESSQFNCSFSRVETIYDVVDGLWLLLQGCGFGFTPVRGTLNGFSKPVRDIKVIRSTRTEKGGEEHNSESWDPETKIWTITVGDSAESWAKSIGKMLAGKHPANQLVLDFSRIRPSGQRLKGYGWISSGDAAISKAFVAIAGIMSKRADSLLTAIDILDIMNHLGTVLSSRRSAEIALLDANDPEWKEFATAKRDFWLHDNVHRCQSNNSLVFHSKPTRERLKDIFDLMIESGGSEPGFINGEAATRRAPWFAGCNPCVEIILGNKGFCVSGDTPLITRDGIVDIRDAVGKDVEIWNGEKWSSVSPRITGENQKMLRVAFSDGSYLDCTEYHRFSVKNRFSKNYKEVMAKDLIGSGGKYKVSTESFDIKYEDGTFEPLAYTYGAAYGDGYANRIDLYGDDKFDVNELFSWDRVSILNFFAGLADTDGSLTASKTLRIYQGNEGFIRKMQLLLTKIGIKSSVNLMADIGKSSNFNRLKAMWYLQIIECQDIPCHRIDTSNGHKSTMKGKNQNVRSVTELDGLHISYCFDEPERHMGVFNNTLTYQCNLCEIDIGKFHGDSSGLRDAIRLAARANYRQTCVNLKDGILQEAWHLNNEFLRLCGVGLTGVARRDDLGAYEYQELQRVATSAAYSMADELGTPHPKNITTVKPSGCRPWDALTSTTGGILTLEELLSDHTLHDEWCDYTGGLSVLQDGEENRITKTYNNGLAEVFEVRMNHGLIVESTADHPWFVKSRYRGERNAKYKYEPVNQWVKTIDLRDQDVIDTHPGIYKSEVHSPLIQLNSLSLKMRDGAIEILQPEFLNNDLSWLLGYLWGDGSMSPLRYRFRWIDQHKPHLEKLQRVLFEQFGLTTSVLRASQERGAYMIEAGSKMLWHWFMKNGISKYGSDQLDLIPRVVRSSSATDIAAFIAGLVDSDGCIGVNKKTQKRNVMISSADRRFIKHVQDVGWSIGLAFGMSHNQLGQNLQMRKSMYLSTLTVHTLPSALEMLLANCCKMQNETRGDFWMGENGTHLNGDTIGKVRGVKSVGVMPTYDIEVENNHWYYAGAVKSHNTLSKIMDTTEGVHKPLGRYIFNNVNFSKHDPIVKKMKAAGYKVIKNPADPESMLITFPVAWDDVEFSVANGVEVNIETAVSQLDKYKLLQNNWTQQNTSVTISYDVTEVDSILDWLMINWDLYVGVSFIYRADPTKTAADLGYLYLPQEVVTKDTYDEYVAKLSAVDIDSANSFEEINDAECSSGSCPIK